MEKFQKKVEEFVKKYKFKYKPEITALDLVSEIGEVAKEILNSKTPPPANKNCQGICFYIDKINLANKF